VRRSREREDERGEGEGRRVLEGRMRMAVDGERGRRKSRETGLKMKQYGKNMAGNFQGETRSGSLLGRAESSGGARRARNTGARRSLEGVSVRVDVGELRQRKDGRPR